MGLDDAPIRSVLRLSWRRGYLSTVGSVWLTINVLSWAAVFWAVTLIAHGKMKPPIAGWIAIAEI